MDKLQRREDKRNSSMQKNAGKIAHISFLYIYIFVMIQDYSFLVLNVVFHYAVVHRNDTLMNFYLQATRCNRMVENSFLFTFDINNTPIWRLGKLAFRIASLIIRP